MPVLCRIFPFLILVFITGITNGQSNRYKLMTMAFYNVENLFDTIDDPNTADDDYTPMGKNKYSGTDYFEKINLTSKVISQIGSNKNQQGPIVIGLAEVENFAVINDLFKSKHLIHKDYQIIHKDSPDHRGIDVALAYQQSHFQPISNEFIEVKIWNDKGHRLFTRDILYVYGLLEDQGFHLFINHWPSRRGGASKSESKRVKAAYLVKQKTDEILMEDPFARIVIMGDFNDDPLDKSIMQGLLYETEIEQSIGLSFVNPMIDIFKKGGNTLVYRDDINLFDQIIISDNLFRGKTENGGCFYFKAGIYNPPYLISKNGKYKGYPLRSFSNNRYSRGYSDHFPVYIELLKPVSAQEESIPN